MIDFSTKAKNTWCPGCTNFSILAAFKNALNDLAGEGYSKDNFVMVAGIGCHGKIPDYVDINSFMSLHGRDVASAEGIKAGNPNLTVVSFAGDGDAYAEGMEHLVHAAKRNANITLFVHNNQVFGLTTGQVTPTSPKGYRGRSTPFGSPEEPLNPLAVLLASGATFIARAWALDPDKLKEIMKRAVKHKGFSIVDIIQPCITFSDTRAHFKDKVFYLDQNWPTNDWSKAMQKIRENSDKVPLGVIYEINKPVFEEQL
ncbi:MAG: thiamine pyrophosphate-dependent enzyme [Candidatus Magasanikbacteria bacterium]|nr:thiamine pyrophosphate-dependent enzyme [Candidatus Magasanikbacteria bacterium]